MKNSQLTCGEAQGDLGDDALASQASLAIQLTWLANTAEQSAVLEERNRLAGEIHDSLAQFFAGIAMQLGAAKEVFKAGSGNLRLTRKVFGEASACTLKIDAVLWFYSLSFEGT